MSAARLMICLFVYLFICQPTTNLLVHAANVEGDSAVALLSEGYTLAVVLRCLHETRERGKGKRVQRGSCRTCHFTLQGWPPVQVVETVGKVT